MLSNKPPAAAALLSIAFLFGSCGGSGKQSQSQHPQETARMPMAVRAFLTKAVDWPEETEVTGTVRARVTTPVSAKVPGYIREVRVSAGDHVAAGQILVTLDARDLEITRREAEARVTEASTMVAEVEQGIASANAQLALAQATHKRMTDLFEKKSVSNQEFDEAQARLRVAQAAQSSALSRRQQVEARIAQARESLAAAQNQLSYAQVMAPFSGIVIERKAEPGTLAAPGMPLLVVEQSGALRAELSLPESQANRVRIGTPVELELEEGRPSLASKVSEIVPAFDSGSRALTVKADLPAAASARSGSFVRGRFTLGKRSVLAVPVAAVRDEGQLKSVLVVEGREARERLVTAGVTRNGFVEILSGLREGERLVSPRPSGLTDGSLVEVRGE